MKSYVEFSSTAISVYETERAEINPGIYGRRLTEYLKQSLEDDGISTKPIYCEDWGVVLPVVSSEANLRIGMANYEEYENGFLCFIEPTKPKIRLFPRFWQLRDNAPIIHPIAFALNRTLESHDQIDNIKWSTHEDFNST